MKFIFLNHNSLKTNLKKNLEVVPFTQTLIRFKSITPNDEGCLDFIKSILTKELKAKTTIQKTNSSDVLHAIIGNNSKKICFLGHVDVVPVCNSWSYPPFDGVIVDNNLYGRGVSDMKGSISAFINAVIDLKHDLKNKNYEIHIVLTSDEESESNGIKNIINNLPKFDFILVGEPTNPNKLGEMIKIGRRGSLNGVLKTTGISGHIAYPDDSKNPIPELLSSLKRLLDFPLKEDSSLQISSIETNTNTVNIIPKTATAKFNIRFFEDNLLERLKKHMEVSDLKLKLSAEPFVSNLTKYHEILKNSIVQKTGTTPVYSTTGGTSEARFFKYNVAEFGLISNQAHKVDEHIHIDNLLKLKEIYYDFLSKI